MRAFEITQDILWDAVDGLKLAADKQSLSLHGFNVEALAATVTSRVLHSVTNNGSMVAKTKHAQDVEKITERARRFESYWASAVTQADAQLLRVQEALSSLDDRALAKRLADQIGVILTEESDALFEATS
jgi:hypothetical protein